MRKDRSEIVDPLEEARWEQVRGDEDGFRGGSAGEGDAPEGGAAASEPPPVDDDAAGLGQNTGARNAITGDAGDPGGER